MAQYIQIGTLLLPNNLTVNAHGNGYADPNILIPAVIEAVTVDGGAFNVREGNHAVDLATVYSLRSRLAPFVTLTGDRRDIDVSVGWRDIALETSFGDGLLRAPERRRQYKLNAIRGITRGRHDLTFLGIGYSGESSVPGLVPLGDPNDTLDPRQHDHTHTAEAAVNDVWMLNRDSQLQLSGFARTYSLALESNFGSGLIRQSEFRTVAGGNTTYIKTVNQRLTIMAGADFTRDAPRHLDLDRYDPFRRITSNDVTIELLSPYAAIDGAVTRWLRYDIGWRRDQIRFDNRDLLQSANSFHAGMPVDSPKATLTLAPPENTLAPEVALSYGQSFFTLDPRIGIENGVRGSPVARAHSYQLVIIKRVYGAELRAVFGRVNEEQSLAKIDPDTGLQFNQGPSRNRYVSFSARRRFRAGSLAISLAKADARDLASGLPVPEAPRLIFDALGSLERLPFHLRSQAEYEAIGRKPLGDGLTSVPVHQLRGSLVRMFHEGRLEGGLLFLIASGYTGQTTEVLAWPAASAVSERIVGVRIPSYAGLSFTYRPRP